MPDRDLDVFAAEIAAALDLTLSDGDTGWCHSRRLIGDGFAIHLSLDSAYVYGDERTDRYLPSGARTGFNSQRPVEAIARQIRRVLIEPILPRLPRARQLADAAEQRRRVAVGMLGDLATANGVDAAAASTGVVEFTLSDAPGTDNWCLLKFAHRATVRAVPATHPADPFAQQVRISLTLQLDGLSPEAAARMLAVVQKEYPALT